MNKPSRKILDGRDEIMAHLKCSKDRLRSYMTESIFVPPIMKRSGRLISHADALDEWMAMEIKAWQKKYGVTKQGIEQTDD